MKTEIKRIDHLGIVAGVIKDLGIIELIDSRISDHPKEEITTGEAVAGMIINGLGFSNRPLSLTPQFFQSKAMERLFRKGVDASYFNRFKLGRALDDCYQYGCSNLFAEISMTVCQKEKVDCRFNSEDTTSVSLTGEYEPDCDEHAIKITQGYSKDHRPDLKQAIVEMMVSQDGGIPTVYKAHDGNASDSVIFRERSQALIESFKNSDSPKYLIADSKLYAQETVKSTLHHIPFITRVPASVKLEQESIGEMLTVPLTQWETHDALYWTKNYS
ncbi:MAG: IS1634 family transposase [Halobacteriovoraceae bacterium]|nr:IS1634 family transposase [Halobacteriovoraceae bacterium]